MRKLRVTLLITLPEFVTDNPTYYPKENVIKTVKNHITSAIGNMSINNWNFIEESEVLDIQETEAENSEANKKEMSGNVSALASPLKEFGTEFISYAIG